LNGIALNELIKQFKVKLLTKEWFSLSMVTTAGNYLTPFRGGAIARATYLKKNHQFSYTLFLGTLMGTYVITFWINSFLGIVSLLYLNFFQQIFNNIMFIVFVGIFLVLTLIIIFSPKFRKSNIPFLNKIIAVINGWNLVKSHTRTIISLSAITLLNAVLMSGITFFEYRVIGENISVIGSVFVAISSTLSLFISITPGSLGIKEAMIVFSSQIINIAPHKAVTVGILDRLLNFSILLVLSPIFTRVLLNFKKNNETN
jgi:uncharacterized membrane protein YbhN (UPF0104 family)